MKRPCDVADCPDPVRARGWCRRPSRPMPSQADTLAWTAARWPWATTPEWRAIKVGEEAGEVLGAVIKEREGRKTWDDVAQETAQLVICAMALAESIGFDLFAEVASEYDRMAVRTWGTETHESGTSEATP